jgi:ribose transport system permease protein
MHMAVAQASTTAGGTPRPKKWVTFLRNNASLLLIYGLILVVGVYAATQAENFRTMSNMANIGRQTILLGLIAIGQSVVILSGGIDFSVAMIARVVALTVATIFAAQNSNPALIVPLILVGMVVGVALGSVNGLLITRTHANPFIITFGMANILRGICLAISSTPIRGIPKSYLKIYDAKIGIVPINVIVMILIWIAAWLFLNRSRLGRAIYAVGGSERAARLSAIRVNWTLMAAYMFSAFCAAVAALFILSRSGVGDPITAEGMDFQSVVAVALGGISLYGGRGSIWGTLGGVLLLTMMSNVFNLLQVNIYVQQLFLGLIVLIAVAAYKSPRSAS